MATRTAAKKAVQEAKVKYSPDMVLDLDLSQVAIDLEKKRFEIIKRENDFHDYAERIEGIAGTIDKRQEELNKSIAQQDALKKEILGLKAQIDASASELNKAIETIRGI